MSEIRQIADMSDAWNLIFAPHIACSSGTGISLACGLHAALAASNTSLLEFDAYGGPAWDGMLAEPIQVKDGCLYASTSPGLGVDLAPGALERFALKM
jgi:L-alanine-DL-glutamate epimerase-like enolase superfamily enzyme